MMQFQNSNTIPPPVNSHSEREAKNVTIYPALISRQKKVQSRPLLLDKSKNKLSPFLKKIEIFICFIFFGVIRREYDFSEMVLQVFV